MTQPQGDTDFFISYRGARTDWALWVNWVVRSAGFSTVLMDEFPIGTNWTDQMREACDRCHRLIPLYSEDYWDSGACRLEFDTYLAQHVKNAKARFLLPLVVQKCEVPDMDGTLLRKALHPLTRDAARSAILKVLEGITPVTTAVPFTDSEPPFPGIATAPTAPAMPAVPLSWPARCTTFVPDMANRDVEFAFFANTLCGSIPQRATLVAASSDHGKTKLVAEFHRYGCEVLGTHACSFVDFKARSTVSDLWDTLSLDLDARIPGLADRSPSRLREGLRKASKPVLIVFDTFESATEEAREFVQSNFLCELSRTNAVRLLLAGQPQAIPDPTKAAWQAHAKRFNLGNIPDPNPWVDWAARTYPLIPASSVITIVASTGGAPGVVANQLQILGSYSATQLAALGIK